MNNVSEPPYVLRISRSSYVQMSREVESGDAGEIPLLPHARLTGKIVDGQDHPISGANVHLRLSGERTNRINTGLKSQERLIQSYEKRGVLNQNPKVSADQKPVIKAYRSALEHKGSFRVDPESTRTGEDGTFTFTGLLPDHQIDLRRIPPVTYELRIEPPSNHPAIRKSLSLSPGSNTLHLESLEQAAVKGKILWPDGTPVRGEAEMWFDTETDKKRFGVREGPLKQKSPGRNWTGNRFSSR